VKKEWRAKERKCKKVLKRKKSFDWISKKK